MAVPKQGGERHTLSDLAVARPPLPKGEARGVSAAARFAYIGRGKGGVLPLGYFNREASRVVLPLGSPSGGAVAAGD